MRKSILASIVIMALGLFAIPPTMANTTEPWADSVTINGQKLVYGCFFDTNLKEALELISKASGIKMKIDEKEALMEVKVDGIVLLGRASEDALGMILIGTGYWYQKIGENSYKVIKLDEFKKIITQEEIAKVQAKLNALKEEIRKEKEKWVRETKISESFTETSLREALNTIAYDTGVNIFIDQTVEGVTTCEFKGVPLEIALAKILAPYGYTFKKMGKDYLVGTASPDSLSFGELSVTAVIKPNYVSVKEIANSLSDFFRPFIKVNERRNTITVTASPEMVARIKEDIARLDKSFLKKVEIRLVSLEYSRQKKSEISLDSLEVFLGKGLERKNIYGIEIGDELFGASSEDELKSMLRLRILSDLNELTITGDQKTTVLEGETAKIFRSKEGDIFISPRQDEYYSLEKETVQAEQGIEVKVIRVTSENEILLTINGKLEDIEKVPKITESGTAIWINRRNVNTTVPIRNYQTISIGTLSRKTTQKSKGITSCYRGEEEIETLFLLTANVVGTEKPPVITIDKKAEEFFKKIEAKKPIEKAKRLAVGIGAWFLPEDEDSLLVYEAQIFLTESLKLFGGGGKKEERYVAYGGLRYGDLLNIGIGGLNSDKLRKAEFMITGGLSIGTDNVKLEGDYFYLPNAQNESGVRAALEIRF